MKKRIVKTLLIILALALALGLASCTKNEGDAGDARVSAVKYFGVDNLSYNAAYSNPTDAGEKGFVIYDRLELNKISISDSVDRRKGYEIRYTVSKDGKELLTTIDNTKPYIFTETGKYDIKITAGVKFPIEETYSVKVIDGGLPTKIDYEVKVGEDLLGYAQGGKGATVIARVYNNDTLITDFSGLNYSVFWEGGAVNDIEKVLPEFDNKTEDEKQNYKFFIRNKVNTNETADTLIPIELTVKNNLKKIEYVYGWDTANELSIDVNSALSQKMETLISLRYIFDNDEMRDIAFSNTGREEGKAVAYIKYEGKDSYALYNKNSINKKGVANIDVTKYNFDPELKGRAQMYLSVCGKRSFSVNNVFNETKIEGSEVALNITKTDMTTLKAVTYNGFYSSPSSSNANDRDKTAQYYDSALNSYSVPLKADNSIDMYINRYSNAAMIQTDQYVSFDVEMNSDASCPDYYFVLPSESQEKLYVRDYKDDNGKRIIRLYALKEGSFKVLLKSVYDDVAPYEITVNATNPAIGYRLTKTADSLSNYIWMEKYDAEGIKDVIVKHTDIEKVYLNSEQKPNDKFTPEKSEYGSLYYFLNDAANKYTDISVIFKNAFASTAVYDTTKDFDKFVYNRYQYYVGIDIKFDLTDGLFDKCDGVISADTQGFTFFVAKDLKVKFDGEETTLSALIASDKNKFGNDKKITVNAVTYEHAYEGTLDYASGASYAEDAFSLIGSESNVSVTSVAGKSVYTKSIVFDFVFWGTNGGSVPLPAVTVTYAK